MSKILGIRREDKNEWERRVPLTPEDVKKLVSNSNMKVLVQPSPIRVFDEEQYDTAGAIIEEDLSSAEVILAVKEIPTNLLEESKTYVYFSHTIKGQSYNMAMLQRLIELKCNLIDYERIVNDKNQRLIFFGKYAGLAGMIETLYAFGQKMKLKGITTPFEKIKQAYEYGSLEKAKQEIAAIGEEIRTTGLPEELTPLVVGFAGYGNVSKGAQEIINLLPCKSLSPNDLLQGTLKKESKGNTLYTVEFMEKDLVTPRSGTFQLQDYYDNPEKYDSQFEEYLPHLSMLVNCIYWTEKYPRLVTKEYLATNQKLNLAVIGDISCDINGSIEITKDATMPDTPSFTYFPESDNFKDGVEGAGITVMSVDNLPCEFPKEASQDFSAILKEFIPDILSADFNTPYEELQLPGPIKKALILHDGKFTNDYTYMQKFLQEDL